MVFSSALLPSSSRLDDDSSTSFGLGRWIRPRVPGYFTKSAPMTLRRNVRNFSTTLNQHPNAPTTTWLLALVGFWFVSISSVDDAKSS
eukprot:scaffold2383_cov161-Amphora_coffeaeformis.AAC.16